MSRSVPTETFLVDAHVHVHPPDGLEDFIEAAAANFRGAAAALGLSPSTPGCLMLAETAQIDRFAELRTLIGRRCGGWRVAATNESISVMVLREAEAPLFVVAGSQIVTRERLEVLALACSRRIPDGRAIDDVVDDALAAHAIVVVPWGFGKWWFRRGATIRQLLTSERAQSLCLGDNGGRLSWGPAPRLFDAALAKGIPILPGSDALPLPGQLGKVGRYGFVLDGKLDPREPARTVGTILATLRKQPRIFGHRENLGGFVRSQVAMQLRKWRSVPR